MIRFVALFVSLSFFACSGAPPAADAGVEVPDAAVEEVDAGVDAGLPTPVCAPATSTSRCGESAIIRGVAHFDPTRVPTGVQPVLRLALRHSFAILLGEDEIGGRLHMYKSVPVTSVASGAVAFELDLCALGTAMWSEENGPFHVIGILDFNKNNNLDRAMSNADAFSMSHSDMGEPAGVTDVNVSCHQPSSCVSLQLDCVTGTACTTITPITSCTKQTPSCPSDDTFCL